MLLLLQLLLFTGGSESPLSLVVVATAVVYRRECVSNADVYRSVSPLSLVVVATVVV